MAMEICYIPAMATTWTQADIDAIKASIRRGVLTVSFADRSVTYHSLKEMRELLAEMERSVNAGRAFRLAATSKGV